LLAPDVGRAKHAKLKTAGDRERNYELNWKKLFRNKLPTMNIITLATIYLYTWVLKLRLSKFFYYFLHNWQSHALRLRQLGLKQAVFKGKKVGLWCTNGTPSYSYGVSFAIWDYTVLPVTRHKWTHPALTPARQACTRFTYPVGMEGWVDL